MEVNYFCFKLNPLFVYLLIFLMGNFFFFFLDAGKEKKRPSTKPTNKPKDETKEAYENIPFHKVN